MPPTPVKGHWVRHGFRWRKVRSLSIGFKPVWIRVKVPRWRNPLTGEEIEQPPFVRKGANLAQALERFIIETSRFMTLPDVAAMLRLSWGTVKEVVKKRLAKAYRRVGYKRVRNIGIEEPTRSS